MKKSWILALIAIIALILVCVIAITSSSNVEVSFDSLGGTKVETIKVKKGSTITKPENPTKEGYSFIAWMLDGEEFNFDKKITKNIKLTAKWKEESGIIYTISFDTDGGNKVDNIKVKNGKINNLPIPEKKGYTFVGWYNKAEKVEVGDTISKDIILKAKWEKQTEQSESTKKYTVSFDSAGGSKVNSQTVQQNNKVKKPLNPTKDGFIFVEWTLNGKTYNFNNGVTGNITLKAVWKEKESVKEYTVTFDSAGGSKVDKQVIIENGTAVKPEDPTKDKYKFLGWYLDEQLYSFDTKVTKDITLKAKWEYIPTVTYKIEELKGSIVGQAKLFILKDNVKVAGTADVTTSSGTRTVAIPATGLDINKNKIDKVENLKLNE